MVLKICAKGDYNLLSKVKKDEFSEAELYLKTSDDCDDQKFSELPSFLNIVSVHQPIFVKKNDKLKLLDLINEDVQEESIRSIKKTIFFLKKNNIPLLVLHCSSYDPKEDKIKKIYELANIVKSFYNYRIEISFETDILGFNTYLPRRNLLTSIEDFKILDKALDSRLLITIDIEHISVTSLFNSIKERFNVSNLNREEYYKIYFDFIRNNGALIINNFKHNLNDFFNTFKDKIVHIHLNGSDFKNYIIDPKTTLPLLGEHLPLNYKDKEIQDRFGYKFIGKQFKKLPCQKIINIILEIGIRNDKYDFHQEMYKSKLFLEKFIKFNS